MIDVHDNDDDSDAEAVVDHGGDENDDAGA
jgi:hypothetical protein